ncbi:MAG: VG15 protein, partial [Mycobacteriales bacterium]
MLAAAQARYAAQRALSVQTTGELQRLWMLLDLASLDASFQVAAGPMLQRIVAAQLVAASLATRYVSSALAEQDLSGDPAATLVPRAFAGTASDGRPLASLLYEPLITVKASIGQGLSGPDSLARGLVALLRICATQVADAGRAAESVSITSRPRVEGFVRMLNLPSCGRCAVLAGRFYRWNSGFQRHPMCDCLHIPASEDTGHDLRTSPRDAIRSGRVRGLSQADTRAIVEDGADVSQVINAHRGMSTADVYGRQLKVTNEGVTARGVAGQRLAEQG